MSRRVTGLLAWGALALVIGIPSSEVLLKSDEDSATSLQLTEAPVQVDDAADPVAAPNEMRRIAATNVQGPPVPPAIPLKLVETAGTEDDTDSGTDVAQTGASNDAEPGEATHNKSVILGTPVQTATAQEPSAPIEPGKPVELGKPVLRQTAQTQSHTPAPLVPEATELGTIANLSEDDVKMPPMPAPRLDRSRVIVARASSNDVNRGDAIFLSDWQEEPRQTDRRLDTYRPGDFEQYAEGRDVWRRQELRRPLPAGVIPGSTDYLPARRGSAVRLDLVN
jgi:hypothetical protein